jgi:hypothetical protein
LLKKLLKICCKVLNAPLTLRPRIKFRRNNVQQLMSEAAAAAAAAAATKLF